MTLADTSAWVEFARRTGSDANKLVREAIHDRTIVTTEVVVMELLAGAADHAHQRNLRGMLAGARFVAVGGLGTWERAAAIYRGCRRGGFTPHSQLECLIAAIAIREEVAVVHADRDFDGIARHTPLRIASVG